MYSVGWNLICYTKSSNFDFYSFPHFQSSPLTESASVPSIQDAGTGTVGGGIYHPGFQHSLIGIFHSAYFTDSALSSSAIVSNFLTPRYSSSLCDYFIGMFPDLGVQDNSGYFKNLMSGFQTQNQQFQNSLSRSLDLTDGLSFQSGDVQSISSIKITTQRAIGIQLWFKGSFIDGQICFGLLKNAFTKSVYLDRQGNDLRIKSTYSANSIVLTNAINSLDSTGWIFLGISVGWITRNDDFIICGQVSQSTTSYESGNCSGPFTIAASDIVDGAFLSLSLGPGLSGSLKSIYISDILEHPSVFVLFKSSFSQVRAFCFDSDNNQDPHYLKVGCSNGYVFPSETTEECDDLNLINGDGCSDQCKREPLYKCTNGANTAAISLCEFVCRNSLYEPQYDEQCDDGNSDLLDGCTDTCEVETGWDCSTLDSKGMSICKGICGDGIRVADEGCDDGDNADNKGCTADCSAEMNGWYCSGGGLSASDLCVEQCGDGYITTNEQCEDGNTSNLDGCSSTCQIETGWTCTNNAAMTSTTCIAICGDGLRVSSEACDDGNTGDFIGCKTDCSGEINGYYCSGGTATSKDICLESCGDNYITISEECEDGNIISGDGCNSSCKFEPGWTCTNNFSAIPISSCSSNCGDGLKVGTEKCDDGNNTDNKGCLDNCSGVIRGWYCSPGVINADDCITKLMDGIHISSEEGCDDGNHINSGDGCTNLGVVEDNLCIPKCGNGKLDDVDEKCDDFNNIIEDGCNSKCLIEDGWKCFNGTLTTRDYCYKYPYASIKSISSLNEIKIQFTEPMKILDFSNSSSYNISLAGPMIPYAYSQNISFSDEYTLYVNLTINSVMAGDGKDIFKIMFDASIFQSKYGVDLKTVDLSCSLNKIPIIPDIINPIGNSANAVITITMVSIISSNIVLQQSSELLWGFLNTLQMMYFFPLLQLYFPDNFFQILTYLSSTKLKISIPQIEEFKESIKNDYEISENLDMPPLNSRYEALNYDSSGFLVNGIDLFSLILQSMVTCVIIFGLRAIYFSVSNNVEKYENHLESLNMQLQILPQETSQSISHSEVNQDKNMESKQIIESKYK